MIDLFSSEHIGYKDIALRRLEIKTLRRKRKTFDLMETSMESLTLTTLSEAINTLSKRFKLGKNKKKRRRRKLKSPELRTPPRKKKSKRRRHKSSSRYTGVSYNKAAQKWTARLHKPGSKEKTYLGIYETEEDAAREVAKCAKKWGKALRVCILGSI